MTTVRDMRMCRGSVRVYTDTHYIVEEKDYWKQKDSTPPKSRV